MQSNILAIGTWTVAVNLLLCRGLCIAASEGHARYPWERLHLQITASSVVSLFSTAYLLSVKPKFVHATHTTHTCFGHLSII